MSILAYDKNFKLKQGGILLKLPPCIIITNFLLYRTHVTEQLRTYIIKIGFITVEQIAQVCFIVTEQIVQMGFIIVKQIAQVCFITVLCDRFS